MLDAVVAHNDLGAAFRAVVSVDEVRTFKPHPAVYALGAARLGLTRDAIGVRLVERLGCGRGQGVRLPGRLGQPPAAPLDELGVPVPRGAPTWGSSRRPSGTKPGPLLPGLPGAGSLHGLGAGDPRDAPRATDRRAWGGSSLFAESGAILLHQLEVRDPLSALFPEVGGAGRPGASGRRECQRARGARRGAWRARRRRRGGPASGEVGRVVGLGVDRDVPAPPGGGARLGQEVAYPDPPPPVAEPAQAGSRSTRSQLGSPPRGAPRARPRSTGACARRRRRCGSAIGCVRIREQP